MRKKVIAGLATAGVLAISGISFAGTEVKAGSGVPVLRTIARAITGDRQRPPEPPEGFQKGQRPPKMRSQDRPPKPPKERDNKMPPPPKAHSRDKRPPMPPRSGDRRPPEFDGNRPPRKSK